jgi:ribosome maturation factor RimP
MKDSITGSPQTSHETLAEAPASQRNEAPASQGPSSTNVGTPESRLLAFLEETLAAIGYELVTIEILNHREKKLCIYIDRLPETAGAAEPTPEGIGIEDCVRVTRELDAPLETSPEMLAIFKGAYELEVSSPGIDRPLRKPSDFTRFEGEIARIHTFRSLSGDETGAPEYSQKNPKQKNFYGILRGYDHENRSVRFGIIAEDGTRGKPGKKNQSKPETLIRIPHELVSKANLEREVEGL